MQPTFYQQGEESNITLGILQLVASVARLRSPIEGCLWFKQQTFQSLRRYLLEEVYEVLEPLDSESPEKLQQELGDLLFQIIVLCQLASECGWFYLADVLHHVNEKVIHRNPHVFGERRADSMEAAQGIWMEQKALERIVCGNVTGSPLDGLSMAMPALAQAQAYMRRSGSSIGSAFLDPSFIDDIEIKLVSQPNGLEVGLGRLLFSLVDIASRHQLDAEAALQKINAEFRQRVCEQFSKPSEKA